MRMICCSQRLQKPSRRSRSPAAEEPARRVSGPEVAPLHPTWIYCQIEIWGPRGTLLHSTSFPSRFFHVFSHSRLISFFSSHLVRVSSRLFVSAPERRPCHHVSVSMVTDLSNTLQGRKCFKRKRQQWEFVRRTSREVPAESSGCETPKTNSAFLPSIQWGYLMLLTFYCR